MFALFEEGSFGFSFVDDVLDVRGAFTEAPSPLPAFLQRRRRSRRIALSAIDGALARRAVADRLPSV